MISTSIEQAERLLGVGLVRDTADMYWRSSAYQRNERDEWVPQPTGAFTYLCIGGPEKDLDFPAWSLSRLWELVHELDKTYDFDTKMSSEELMELLVKTIEFRFKNRTSG